MKIQSPVHPVSSAQRREPAPTTGPASAATPATPVTERSRSVLPPAAQSMLQTQSAMMKGAEAVQQFWMGALSSSMSLWGAGMKAAAAQTEAVANALPPAFVNAPRTGTTMDWLRLVPKKESPIQVDKDSRLSGDFKSWLANNGYEDLAALDLPAFGGFEKSGGKAQKDPVIFIHGNQSTAADLNPVLGAYAEAGYTKGELYAVTWYDRPKEEYDQSTHAAPTLKMLRRFITAVKEYTGAEKVDVVGHSLGVTLGRKAIKGGMLNDPDNGGWQDLGPPLTKMVDTFIGVAGANQGLQYGEIWKDTPMTNKANGLHAESDLIKDLNSEVGYEGEHVYSIFSPTSDQVLLHEALRSGPIPGEDGGRSVDVWDLDHWDTMMLTGEIQVQMLEHHQPNAGLPDRNIHALYDYMVRAGETNQLTLDIITRKLPAQLIKNWIDFLNGER